MPDTSKTGVPYTPKTRGRRSAAAGADDFLSTMPDTSLPDPATLAKQGVKVAGFNAAGQPILAPQGPQEPKGSAARRFLSSAYQAIKQPLAGTYHGLVEGPQNPEEAAIAAHPFTGPLDLRFERFITGPMKAEARRTAEEWKQSDPWNLHPSAQALEHRQLALGHGLATALPLIGPAAAQMGEQVGTEVGRDDYAAAAGTLAGNAALYLTPKVPDIAETLAKSSKTLTRASETLTRPLTRTLPRGIVTRLIRPAAADVKFGKDPATGVLREGITGNTLEEIGNKVSDRLGEVGRQLDREAQRPAHRTKVIDASRALRPLDDALREAAQGGDQELFNKLQATREELANNWRPFRDAKGNITLRKTGPRSLKMSPAEALKFKRMIGDRVRWTGEPLQGAVNKALGSAYGNIKDALNSAVPELKDLNERYANLVGAAKSIQRRLPVAERNAHWSLSDIALGATGHVPLAIVRKLARTPAVTSRTAQMMYSLPGRTVPKAPLAVTAPVTGAAAAHEDR
jgi:hypothetical protein